MFPLLHSPPGADQQIYIVSAIILVAVMVMVIWTKLVPPTR
jgi:hypothetical protein